MPADKIFNITGGNPPNPGTGNTSIGESSIGFDTTSKTLKIFDGTTLYSLPFPVDNSSMISAAGATLTATAPLHAARTIALNQSGGTAVTLPAATGTGNRYRFVVTVASNANTILAAGSDKMGGGVLINDAGDTAAATVDFHRATVASSNKIAPTTAGGGGAIGDFIEAQDVLSAVWAITGVFATSTDPVNPFSAV